MRGAGARVRDVNKMSAMFLHCLARELDRHKPPTMAEANLQWETAGVLWIDSRPWWRMNWRKKRWLSLALKSRLNCNFKLMWKDQRRRRTRRSRLFIISSQMTASGSPTSLVLPLFNHSEVDWTATWRRKGLLPVIVFRRSPAARARAPPPRKQAAGSAKAVVSRGSGQRGSGGRQSLATILFSSMTWFAVPYQSEVAVHHSPPWPIINTGVLFCNPSHTVPENYILHPTRHAINWYRCQTRYRRKIRHILH